MSNVLIEKNTLDDLAEMIAAKSGEALPLSLSEMIDAVHGIEEGGGGITPTGNIDITQAGVTDVTDYATATVPELQNFDTYSNTTYYTAHSQRYYETVTLIDPYQDGFLHFQDGVSFNINTISGAAVAANTTITPTTSAQTVGGANYMMEGAVTVAAMPSGSATPAASISGTSATVSTGTNTLTLSKTVSNTPQVSAGYVSAGTAGNSNVSLTANVTTKAATTYHPSASQQTIASGTYLTGTQTINAVTTTNLTAANIKNGVVVTVGDSSDPDSVTSVTGTYSGDGGSDWQVDTKTITASNYPVSIQFTGMKGQPKAFFLRCTSQISSSGSTTYYYIIDMRYNGTNTTGNCFRIGSTRRVENITSGYSWSYSGTTLIITSSASSRSASPGAFNNGYELTYFY